MRWKQSVGVVALGLALVAASCSGDNGGSATATTARATSTAGGVTTTAGSSTSGGRTAATGGSNGKTSIAIGETLAPVSLDITQQSGTAVPQALLYNVYETLVRIDDQGAFQPLLASDY